MSAQLSHVTQTNQVNLVASVNANNVVDQVWRIYLILLENGMSNDVKITPLHQRIIGCDGVKIIGNRFSNLIQASVTATPDNSTGIICIHPTRNPLGRSLNSESITTNSKYSNFHEGRNWRGKLPRPPNSFILYRQHHHPLLKKQHPNMHNNEISLILGKQWQSESENVKSQFKALAENLKKQHLLEHPDYQYQPRKPSEKKRRMTRRKAELAAAQTKSPYCAAPNSKPTTPKGNAAATTTQIDPTANPSNELEHSFLPQLETTPHGNAILNLGDNNLSDVALESLLEKYNVNKPTKTTIQGHEVPFQGSAALYSEPSQEAQDDINFYSTINAHRSITATTNHHHHSNEFDSMLAEFTNIYDT